MLPIIKFTGELPERLKGRSQLSDAKVMESVRAIIAGVRERGDAALIEYTERFDRVRIAPDRLRVTEEEIDAAYANVDERLLRAIRASARRIRAFHEKQKQKTWLEFESDGYALGQKVTPMGSAAVYVPGGTAMYPSSVLMNVIPASVAGVERIAMLTPPMKDGSVYPLTLVSAREAGATEIYRVGGAQAIAAAAFGTESIARVDKITGPGNIFVANAKREVYGYVGIDMIAGPSEVLVVADADAPARYVAADMLSQAEHDALAQAVLITDSEQLAREVQQELPRQLAQLGRSEIAGRSIDDYGADAAQPVRVPGAGQKRRRDIPGPLCARAFGRLLRRSQPCAAHVRHGAVLLAPVGGRLCQKVLHNILRARGAGQGGGRRDDVRRRRGAGRARALGGDTLRGG